MWLDAKEDVTITACRLHQTIKIEFLATKADKSTVSVAP